MFYDLSQYHKKISYIKIVIYSILITKTSFIRCLNSESFKNWKPFINRVSYHLAKNKFLFIQFHKAFHSISFDLSFTNFWYYILLNCGWLLNKNSCFRFSDINDINKIQYLILLQNNKSIEHKISKETNFRLSSFTGENQCMLSIFEERKIKRICSSVTFVLQKFLCQIFNFKIFQKH